MKLRMHENSLFAILLRSPWWASFAIAALLFAIARLLVPAEYVLYAAVTPLPFIVIGAMAAWKQLQAPSAKRIEATVARIRAMSTSDFIAALEEAYRRDGYTVNRLERAAADLEILKLGRRSIVACRKGKIARAGIEPLRELAAARESLSAQECVFVTIGELTDNARRFAAEQRITVVQGPGLATLLRAMK